MFKCTIFSLCLHSFEMVLVFSVSNSMTTYVTRIYFPVDEVTVSVEEETGKSVFIDREN